MYFIYFVIIIIIIICKYNELFIDKYNFCVSRTIWHWSNDAKNSHALK